MHGTFTILGIDFPAYFTLLMVGFMAGIYWAFREGPREGINPNKILDLGILAVVCGIAGGRLAHVLFDGQLTNYFYLCVDPLQTTGEFLTTKAGTALACADDAQCKAAGIGEICHSYQGTCHWGQDCLRVFKFWYGGLTYYGGFLLVVPAGIWFLRRNNINPWAMGDLAAFALPFGIAFGRLGCWFAGCCFGSRCDLPWGVEFPRGSPAWRQHFDNHWIDATAAESLSVHPAQLYTVGALLALAVFMFYWYRKRRTFVGECFWLMALIYAGLRFVVEVYRADERGGVGFVSTSQWIGVLLAAVSIYMLSRFYKRAKRDDKLLEPGALNPSAALRPVPAGPAVPESEPEPPSDPESPE